MRKSGRVAESEKERVDRLVEGFVEDSPYAEESNLLQDFINETAINLIKSRLAQGRILELGSSNGAFSGKLAALGFGLDTVEGATLLCDHLKKKALPDHRVFESLFEAFEPEHIYSTVVAAFVNEHVIDPQIIYDVARRALLSGGHLLVIVPNRQAMSRQLAVEMGLLPSLDALSEADLRYGHRRTYDLKDLRDEVKKSGLTCVSDGGLLMKPLADFQLNELLSEGFLTHDHLEGLEKLGHRYPELCMSLYAIVQAP